MRGRRGLTIIRDLASFPQSCDVGCGLCVPDNILVTLQRLQRQLVLLYRRARQTGIVRQHVQRGGQGLQRREIQIRIAPLQGRDGIEAVVFQRLNQILVERRAAPGAPKGSVVHVPARAPRDLPEFRAGQATKAPSVEFAIGGEGDVIDVQVQTHADRVRGDNVIDVAVLIEINLGVTGFWAERANHHRRAAPLALDPLGDGVDFLRRKGDDGASRRQPRYLALASIGQAG